MDFKIFLADKKNQLTRYQGTSLRYAIAAAAVVGLSVLMLGVREQLGVLNVMLLFLLLSLGLGLTVGPRPAAVGAGLAFLAFDYFFIPPYHTLSITSRDHVLGLFAFLGVAIVAAILVGKLRQATDDALRESRRTNLLYQLNRSLVGDAELASLLNTVARSVVEIYGSRACRILIPEASDGILQIQARWPESISSRIDRQAAVMAGYAFEEKRVVGLGGEGRRIRPPHGTAPIRRDHESRSMNDVLFVPVTSARGVLGVLEVTGKPGNKRYGADDELVLTSFADQAALAIERTRFVEEATRVAVLEQSNDLKSALLSAVSHDLRTPLTAIKASSSALLAPSIDWPEEERAELLLTIDEEADRLTLMVANLLDLSRIEGGALKPDRDWQDLEELIHDAVQRSQRQIAEHRIELRLVPDLPVVFLDYVEIVQVMINLIGNAAKYSEGGSLIAIAARYRDNRVRISVTDSGRGIPPESLAHIFDPFVRINTGSPVSGSGIGLAICRGLVEAHGGTIEVASRYGEGTTVTFELPVDPLSGRDAA